MPQNGAYGPLEWDIRKLAEKRLDLAAASISKARNSVERGIDGEIPSPKFYTGRQYDACEKWNSLRDTTNQYNTNMGSKTQIISLKG